MSYTIRIPSRILTIAEQDANLHCTLKYCESTPSMDLSDAVELYRQQVTIAMVKWQQQINPGPMEMIWFLLCNPRRLPCCETPIDDCLLVEWLHWLWTWGMRAAADRLVGPLTGKHN